MPKKANYYADYLQLDKLLSIQELMSVGKSNATHHELFFMINHQVYELWFKQILTELDVVLDLFSSQLEVEKNLANIHAHLQRITKIQTLLIQQLDVLKTLTALDFLSFRHLLEPASGFQSYQFRLIEIKLGLRNQNGERQSIYFQKLQKKHQKFILKTEQEPSLFQLVEQWLENIIFPLAEKHKFLRNYKQKFTQFTAAQMKAIRLMRNKKQQEEKLRNLQLTQHNFSYLFDAEKYQTLLDEKSRFLSYHGTVAALYILLNQNDIHVFEYYQMLQQLIDIDELFRQWRFEHMLMAQRMIGHKLGTGGTSGYYYLKLTVEQKRIFTDLSNMATFIMGSGV
jgi:tryptophan 2,3-dioxygenase